MLLDKTRLTVYTQRFIFLEVNTMKSSFLTMISEQMHLKRYKLKGQAHNFVKEL